MGTTQSRLRQMRLRTIRHHSSFHPMSDLLDYILDLNHLTDGSSAGSGEKARCVRPGSSYDLEVHEMLLIDPVGSNLGRISSFRDGETVAALEDEYLLRRWMTTIVG